MVETTTPRTLTAGNGVTTVFPIAFYFLQNADIKAKLVNNTTKAETLLTITTHYTLTGAADEDGGNLTMLTAPAAGESLLIYLDPDDLQQQDFTNNNLRPGATNERGLDKLTMLIQRLRIQIGRAVRLPEGYSATFDAFLPTLPVLDGFLKMNTTGTGLEWTTGTAPSHRVVVGTRAAPTELVGATGLPFTSTSWDTINFIQGSGGAVTLTAAARIQAGTVVGQRLTLIGRSDAQNVIIPDGQGVETGGQNLILMADTIIVFVWDGTNWVLESTNGLM